MILLYIAVATAVGILLLVGYMRNRFANRAQDNDNGSNAGFQ
jgi:hypothetical protein